MTKVSTVQLKRGRNGEKDPADFAKAGKLSEAINDAMEPQEELSWLEDFELTDGELEDIADPTWVYKNLIIQGHYMILCGAPNIGKTTLMMKVCADVAAHGYRVIYINADSNPSDAKEMTLFAREHGFRVLFPDMKEGKDVRDVMDHLKTISESSGDYSDVVIVIDTLKKIADVMDKRGQKNLYRLMRKLNGRGITIVINAHTNKYSAADGRPIHEGTADVRSDCDELIYLVGEKDPLTKKLTVSTLPDKVRGVFEPKSFVIDKHRNVTPVGYVDVLSETVERKQHDDDADLISKIEEVLKDGPLNQSSVVDALKGQMNRNVVRRVLRAYGRADSRFKHWTSEKTFQKHEWRYRLVRAD